MSSFLSQVELVLLMSSYLSSSETSYFHSEQRTIANWMKEERSRNKSKSLWFKTKQQFGRNFTAKLWALFCYSFDQHLFDTSFISKANTFSIHSDTKHGGEWWSRGSRMRQRETTFMSILDCVFVDDAGKLRSPQKSWLSTFRTHDILTWARIHAFSQHNSHVLPLSN